MKFNHEIKLDEYQFQRILSLIQTYGNKIMTAVADFVEKQNVFNDQMDAAVLGLSGDIKALNDEIVKLQEAIGELSPEDKALLDGLQVRAQGIADKLTALDALTPPVLVE